MRSDRRARVALTVLAMVAIGGLLVFLAPERAREIAPVHDAQPSPDHAPTNPAYAGEVHERFQQAALMLHAGQYLYALEALDRVIELSPRLPEARVNAGYALLGLARPDRARVQFEQAIELRPQQVNAYYGLAMAYETLGNLEGALGAMRTYVHLSDEDDPYRRRALSAIWEWERQREDIVNRRNDDEPTAASAADRAES